MTVILHQQKILNTKHYKDYKYFCEALLSTKNVKHNTDYKDSEYHYKASPSATHPLNKRKEIEKETEKVNLENMSKRRH